MSKGDSLYPNLGASEAARVSLTPSSRASPTIYTPSTSPRSQPSSRHHSPLRPIGILANSKKRVSPPPQNRVPTPVPSKHITLQDPKDFAGDLLSSEDEKADWEDDMETRPPLHRPTDGRSQQPLLGGGLKDERGRPPYEVPNGSARPAFHARRSTFRSRSPDMEGASAVKKKYMYAAFFLVLSLITFVIQTETAVYVADDLGWNHPYAMLYFTHGSWSLLWPVQLLLLRLTRWRTPWRAFWRRHVYIIRSTAQMVVSQDAHLTTRESHKSPVPYMLKTMAIVTTALTVAGSSWYVAVDLTTASDLTAIYNCSAFFAYAFSIPLLGDKMRFDKIFAVVVAIVGVMTVVYGDSGASGDDTKAEEGAGNAKNRLAGNVIIGIGSVLYGLYEVLYKKMACPPEGISPGRGMIFANLFGSLIGCFTLFVLWIPLPILHFTNIERFALPTGKAAWVLLISVFANATFSGSFLVLISLTSPVLSSVAALLTVFLVALADWAFKGATFSKGAIIGGLLIIGAFFLLTWSTYRESVEDRRKAMEQDPIETSDEED